MEICRKEGKSCHIGMSQPFALEDELVMTMGSDGVIRVTFERLNEMEVQNPIYDLKLCIGISYPEYFLLILLIINIAI